MIQRVVLGVTAVLMLACSSEDPRTQITLMIDADPLVKSQLESVRVSFRSAPIGSPLADYVARPDQVFDAPIEWPLVLALLPIGDDPNRAFQIEVDAENDAGVVVEASARSHFVKGKTLALRMRLLDGCRNAVFGSCDDTQTCVVNNGTPSCADNEIDPNTLPPFVSVDPESDAGIDSQVPVLREVTGRVFSTNGFLPLAGAQVAVVGGNSATTDADGVFTLQREISDSALLVEHPDHAQVFKTLPDAESVYIEVFVKEIDARIALSATVGGRVNSSSGANATFPPNALKQPNGSVELGMADVTLTVPDTKDPAQAQAFPGDFKATEAGGKQGAFSAVTALDLSATSTNGKLNIADGEEVDVSFPVKVPSARATADLWSFDTLEQSWKKEGTATLTQDSSGNVVYRAKITHLSWWAVGTLIEDVTCMHLCATYNDAEASYARATISGIDQPLTGSFYADATGCVAFDVPLSTQVSVSVQSIDGVAAPQVVISGDTIGSSSDLSTCQDLGSFTLVDRSQTESCPGALTQCSATQCIDLSADAQHCGGCSAPACRPDQTCVAGTCACSNSQTLCGNTCVDLSSSSANCGACGTRCAVTQHCSQARCVETVCAPPTVSCNGICVNLALDGVNGQCPPTMSTPECVVPTDCAPDEMCDDNGACVPLAVCASDGDCPSAYRCNDMTFVCEVPNCGMAGYTYCGGGTGCVNLNDNPTSCGACGRACSGDQLCESGACVTCPDPNCAAVGATCGPLSNACGVTVDCGSCNAPDTCGGGGVPNQCGSTSLCGDGIVSGSEICDDGNQQNNDGCTTTCLIESGFVCPNPGQPCLLADVCNGADDDSDSLVDEDFVPITCGNAVGECVQGMTACVGGVEQCTGASGPVAEACDGLDNDCDGAIDDGFSLQGDVNNCGACGNVCSFINASATCNAGSCQLAACNGGWTNCDGTPTNGCESNLLIDSNNCGACGNVCPGVTTCSTGLCL